MKLLLLLLGVVGLGPPLLAIPTAAWAESRTPAEATVHALDELANVCAQRRPECPTSTPTLTPVPTPTWTPSPTSTSTPVPPTDTPTQTPIPAPCWLTNTDLGDPDNGYIVFAADGAPVPCPIEQVVADEPTPIVTPSPTATPRPAAQPAAAPAQVLVVVQTVVVVVTAQPVDTATTMPTSAPIVVVVEASATPTAVLTATPQPSAASTPVAAVVSARTAISTAILSPSAAPALEQGPAADRGWLYASVLVCVGLGGLAALWLARRGRRRYAP